MATAKGPAVPKKRNNKREEAGETASTGGRARAAGSTNDERGEGKVKDPRGRKPLAIPMAAINVRLPATSFPLIDKCIEESPIEFGSVADFIRRAVENELRRRGKVKRFAED